MATIQNKGPFLSLVAQLDKLARHNRQGSFRTRERYYEACKRFCTYLAAEYHLQKLENISGKHLVSYVLYLQDNGKSASTVKTDLAAIRFFHDKMSHPKYTLPTNSELGVELERRRFGQLDRTWSGPEFNRLLGKAMAENRDDFILALYLGRYAGFRIHECFRMDTAAAEQALRENALTVKGKGGKVRTVPIEDERILMMLKRVLAQTERGHKLLVPDGMPTDRAINALELFIYRHRNEISDEGSDRRLTFHGLRHTYAAEKHTNPTEACILPRIIRKEMHPLEEDQVAVFLREVQGHPHEYLYKIALFTGLREGEVLGLGWEHIDFQAGTLTVKRQLRREQKKGGQYYFSPPKNNRARSISLAPSVVLLFRLQKLEQNSMRMEAGDAWEEHGLIFTNQTGGYLSYRTVYDCFKRIVRNIGAPATRFHDLRHTFAVASIKSGDDIKTVQENLGHATAAFTLDVYGHVTKQMKQDSAARMEQFIKSVSDA